MNIHPTKREVHFLDEELIVEKVADAIQQALAGQGKSRTFQYQVRGLSCFTFLSLIFVFQTQTLLTGGTLKSGANSSNKGNGKETAVQRQEGEDSDGEEAEGSGKNGKFESEIHDTRRLTLNVAAAQPQKKIYSKDKIRMSHADRTLDSMFAVVNPSTQPSGSNTPQENAKYRGGVDTQEQAGPQPTGTMSAVRGKDIEESVCYLTSVTSLRKSALKAKHIRKKFHSYFKLGTPIFTGVPSQT